MSFRTINLRLAAAWILLTAAGPLHAQDAPVVNKLSDNVYSIFWGFYNGLAVIGDEGVLITDPANNNRAAVLKDEIAKLTDLPVTHIVLSHEHFDHIGGTDAFDGAEIIAQQNINAVLPLDPLNLAPDQVDVTFADTHVIDMGTTKVELHYLGAADGVASTVVYVPDPGILFTADIYEDNRLTPAGFLDDTNMLGVKAVLDEVSGWDLKYSITAHSVGNDPAGVHANQDYFGDLYDAVFPPLQEAANSDNPFAMFELLQTLPETVKLEKYSDWEGYEHIPGHVSRMALAIVHGG